MTDLLAVSAMDTIVAQASPVGRGGVSIVRISGPMTVEIMQRFLGQILPPRYAQYLPFLDRNDKAIDQGIALYFSGPDSFTGEHVLELQCHGGPIIVDLLINEAVFYGCRLARPGEFSERAFLNDKIDLVQAEAIADLIDSSSAEAARGALESLQGAFSAEVHQLVEELIHLRTYVESAIDFPEEEIDFLADDQVSRQLNEIIEQVNDLFERANEGSKLREGIKVVIVGKPNAGKSSLLNALARRESAIVTDIPGTTRDLLRESILIGGIPLHIVDTAGLRESQDKVEQEGMRRAINELAGADHVLLISEIDNPDTLGELKIPELSHLINQGTQVTQVLNKIDRLNLAAEFCPKAKTQAGLYDQIKLSAKSGDGLDILRDHLTAAAGTHSTTEGTFTARRRHLIALKTALEFLNNGHRQLHESLAGELLAEDLREAQQALAEITGAFTSDDLLGRIFSDFCIGK